jgi:CBS-domain-containing membrane protein
MKAAERMTVAFFLLPKRDVVWIPMDVSMRHAFLRMEETGYTAIPMLDRYGCYAGTLTEGDLLRKLMYSTQEVSVAATEQVRVAEVPLRTRNAAVDIEANVEELFERAIEQNFVPVKDGRGAFIGIVRRREILQYCAASLRAKRAPR